MLDEGQVIQRVLAGETSAFRQIVDSYQPVVFQFARNILKNLEDAEDLTQDLFVAAFRNLASFDATKARLTTWLLTIARNRCCNQLKRLANTTPTDVDIVDGGPLPDVFVSLLPSKSHEQV